MQQSPIGSGFTAASTAADVMRGLELAGKTAIVTGAGSGLGFETARVLARAGARVIAIARREVALPPGVEFARVDLADPASIDGFAFSGRLHVLVNSAGIMALPALSRDARGYEQQFATNHLGHFQLTRRLLPALRAAGGARVVSVSSWGHRYSPVVFEDVMFERRPYAPLAAYGQSKSANALLAVALDERERGNGIAAFAVHPGTIVGTGLDKHVSQDELRRYGAIDEHGARVIDPSRNFKTVEQGAATQVWCATSAALDGRGGLYCENCDVAPIAKQEPSPAGTRGVYPHAIDPELARRLWAVSERLCGPSAP